MSTGAVLGLTGAAIVAVSAVYYAVDVLRGGTRPQRTSWGVWALVGVLGVASSDAGGAGPGMYAAAVDAVACAATFLLSLLPRYGKPGGRRLDPALGLVAVLGVALWQFGPLTDAGAAICAVTCDAVAFWPTLREGRRRPDLESRLSWTADIAGTALCLAAVGTASVAALVYPIYLVAAAATMSFVLFTAPKSEPPGELGDTPAAHDDRGGRRVAAAGGGEDAGANSPCALITRPRYYGNAGTSSCSTAFFSSGGATYAPGLRRGPPPGNASRRIVRCTVPHCFRSGPVL